VPIENVYDVQPLIITMPFESKHESNVLFIYLILIVINSAAEFELNLTTMNEYLSQINLLAAITCTIGYFILGSVWYSPALFGKTWQELQKIDPEKMSASRSRLPIMLSATFVLNLVIVVAVGLLIAKTGIHTLLSGVKLGLLCSIAFVCTTLGITFLFEGRPFKLFLIDAGYHTCGILMTSIVLTLWT
jgi:hypothetical protein